MPDRNPTRAQEAARKKTEKQDADAGKIIDYGRKSFANTPSGSIPRSYSKSEQANVLEQGGYDPSSKMLRGLEQDRATRLGEASIRTKAYADGKIDENGVALHPASNEGEHNACKSVEEFQAMRRRRVDTKYEGSRK